MGGANAMEKEGRLVSMICDEDTVTGFLLAGIGDTDSGQMSNYMLVDSKTSQGKIEEAFKNYTKRNDIAVILINQWIAEEIRHVINDYNEIVPTVIEIPSKDHPYDPDKDTMYMRILRLMGRAINLVSWIHQGTPARFKLAPTTQMLFIIY